MSMSKPKISDKQYDSHSDTWWEGYNCLKPRMTNPYKTEEPGTVLMHKEWVLGWECRFFGESP